MIAEGYFVNIEYFGNDKYRVLNCMAERQISVNGDDIIKLSQQEISDILKLSKVKINALISELKNDGYVIQKSPRGKYSLTDKSKIELASIKNMGVER